MKSKITIRKKGKRTTIRATGAAAGLLFRAFADNLREDKKAKEKKKEEKCSSSAT